MDRSRHGLRWPVLVAAAALALLPVLALLQYRWIAEVSIAERERLQAGLGTMTARFSQEFNMEVTRELASLRTDLRAAATLEEHAALYAESIAASPHPRMIRRVLAAESSEGEIVLYEWANARFQAASWPPEWGELRDMLRRRIEGAPMFGPRRMAAMFGYETPVLAIAIPAAPMPRVNDRRGDRLAWEGRGRYRGPMEGPPRLTGWLLAELDFAFLKNELIPEIAGRTFGYADFERYHMAIVSRGPGRRAIYSSAPGEMREPDATAALLQIQPQVPGRTGAPGEPWRFPGWGVGGPPMGRPLEDGRWELQLRYRSGSLDEVVAAARMRNLSIGFAVLLLMAAGIVITVVAAHRAQRLALAQMEFVAGVSHELRTPLAVVCSAADNLADGLIASEQQARRYGSVIRKEGRRLSAMVEQILGFAGAQSGRAYDLQPVDIETLISRAIEACESELHEAGSHVRREIEPDLPPVMADPVSMTQALKNLLSNAVKYASGPPWVTIRAWLASDGNSPEVRISVEDRGAGIERAELERIFEPFYRSPKTSSGVHGLGLGLPLVRRIVEAHNGRVTVKSTPAEGSCFTLHLPALTTPVEEAEVEDPSRQTGAGQPRES